MTKDKTLIGIREDSFHSRSSERKEGSSHGVRICKEPNQILPVRKKRRPLFLLFRIQRFVLHIEHLMSRRHILFPLSTANCGGGGDTGATRSSVSDRLLFGLSGFVLLRRSLPRSKRLRQEHERVLAVAVAPPEQIAESPPPRGRRSGGLALLAPCR